MNLTGARRYVPPSEDEMRADIARYISTSRQPVVLVPAPGPLDTPCWLVVSHAPTPDGYARLQRRGQRMLAARVAWELLNGAWPPGTEASHLCGNRACARPGHVMPESHAANMVRARRATCRRGEHAMTPDNVISANGRRSCRACKAAANGRRYAAMTDEQREALRTYKRDWARRRAASA